MRVVRFQRISHDIDHCARRKHPQFDRTDIEILEAGIDLRTQERDRRDMHCADAAGVLRGQRRDRAQPMHAMRGNGLEIGLDAGAPTGIGTSDGKDATQCPT